MEIAYGPQSTKTEREKKKKKHLENLTAIALSRNQDPVNKYNPQMML